LRAIHLCKALRSRKKLKKHLDEILFGVMLRLSKHRPYLRGLSPFDGEFYNPSISGSKARITKNTIFVVASD